MTFISCERTNEFFGSENAMCSNGDVSVNWLKTANINTQNRAYQREKVSTVEWKQEVMRTVLVSTFAGIPEIHIRVIKTEGGYRFELVDGQQRTMAILDFLSGEYSLPAFPPVNGCDISNMNINQIRDTYPAIYDMLLEYRISCKWYENLTDLQTADLFINVLNNVNDMKPQEMRNAILGVYSEYVRNTARFEPHEIFERYTEESKGKTFLKYFSNKFTLAGRMEVDEWLSTLIYLHKNGVRQGITHDKHFQWVKSIQSATGEYAESFVDKKEIDELLNFGLAILSSVPNRFKEKLNPMTSLMLILYADDLRTRYGDVIPAKYTESFFDVYTRWSDTNKKLYADKTTANGNQMPPFNELFGGKNSNAIQTIFSVLDSEFEDLKPEVGIIEIDKRNFTRSDIIRKWQEQGGKCYYTGEELEENNLAGDHYIPRSYGVARGGVTEYSNLVITSKRLNIKKGNMSGDEFMLFVKSGEAA